MRQSDRLWTARCNSDQFSRSPFSPPRSPLRLGRDSPGEAAHVAGTGGAAGGVGPRLEAGALGGEAAGGGIEQSGAARRGDCAAPHPPVLADVELEFDRPLLVPPDRLFRVILVGEIGGKAD